jgi:viroplasmin and RNaseH domain-containing protein
MAKKKVYAVRKGKKIGLFYSWNECEAAVSGYPGAEYKGFATEEEANAYLGMKQEIVENHNTDEIIDNKLLAYVDGSFDETLGKYAFGCIIITPNGETIKEFGNGDNPESLAIRNVAGEMLGAMYAVKWAIKNGYDNIELHYDYEGIEKWAIGEWKAKNTLTQKYAAFMKKQQFIIRINFQKVKAHSGDFYNEEADRLAKKALTEGNGIPKIKRGDFWFTVEGISEDDFKAIVELTVEEIGTEKIVEEDRDIAYGKSVSLTQTEKKDKVVINHYGKNNKLVMQGKPGQIFSIVVGYVTELVDVEEIPQIFNNTYNLTIDKDEVCSEFQFYLPNSYNKLPPKISRTLHQAVYNLKLDGDMFDGTFLAQPVVRVLEAHLKMILKENNIISDYKYIKDNGFDMFDKIGAKYKLKPDRYGSAKEEHIKYIGNIYTFYHNNRHPLSHWDDPTGIIDTTKLLDAHGAHDLIKRTLSIIDEYYEVI